MPPYWGTPAAGVEDGVGVVGTVGDVGVVDVVGIGDVAGVVVVVGAVPPQEVNSRTEAVRQPITNNKVFFFKIPP